MELSAGQGFPPQLRLRRRGEFDRVYRQRMTVSDNLLVMHGAPNELGVSRLGLAVSRRAGNAVRRNRWKRTIREAFRSLRRELPASLDLVVSPRHGAEPNLAAITASLVRLSQRLTRKLVSKSPRK